MQTVVIEKLAVNTTIGVFDWERAIAQKVLFDIVMTCDMTKAFVSDDVADVINYKTVCDEIEKICHNTKAQLVEYLAYQVMSYLFDKYSCQKIKLTLKKPYAFKKADAVGVCLELTYEQYQKLPTN